MNQEMEASLEGGITRLPLESGNISVVTTTIFPPLHHFCCCISLINGVRIITALSFMFGVGFMQLGSMHSDTDFTDLIAVFCHLTGLLFLFWFLTLLLLLSLQLHRPRRLTAWTALALTGWLCFTTVIYITFTCMVLTLQLKNGEKILLCGTIFSYILAFVVVFYSYWVLSSYLRVLKDIQRSLRSASEPNFTLSISPKPSTPSALRNPGRTGSNSPHKGIPKVILYTAATQGGAQEKRGSFGLKRSKKSDQIPDEEQIHNLLQSIFPRHPSRLSPQK